MRTNASIRRASACLTTLALLVAGTLTTMAQSQLAARALTPQEIHDYGLPEGTQPSGGLFTVGTGLPVYLEAQVDIGIAPADILGVVWTLTNTPPGSTAMIVDSPVPAAAPIFSPGDREILQVADRKMLRPDRAGKYTVIATVTTTGGVEVLTQDVTAGEFIGAATCLICHDGGTLSDKRGWLGTGHATFFTEAIDGLKSSHYNANCIECHVLGYDTSALAVNGGFDDVAAQYNWTFPTELTNGNWAAMPEALQRVSNIQCEHCHGAGKEHALLLGGPGAKEAISVSLNAGDCAQCHAEEPYHFKPQEWENSRHAVATRYPTGENRAACVRCHSGIGFIDFVDNVNPPRTDYEAIVCGSCHDPHEGSNPSQLRTVASVTLMDGITTITNGGKGQLCMNCHMGRRDAVTYVETSGGSSHFGPHYGPQTDMLMGANAITYGKVIGSSAHKDAVPNTCTACHLQEMSASDPGFLNVGGHTFRPGWDGGTPDDPSDDIHLTELCSACHGEIESFNITRDDYDGDGVVEGVQTEVRDLLDELGALLPPIGDPEVAITSSFTRPQLRAAFNWEFVHEDGSFGIHNTAYAVGLLKASIADLTDDGNKDGIPDSWQLQYFTSINDPNAAPNASPAGDGIPNWLKYALGLDPMVAGVEIPGGVVWANGKNLMNPPIDPGATNTVAIFTAAEVVFNTEVGKSYQIQAVSSLSDGWQDLGGPIAGDGAPFSYVTPTRGGVQQFYRVLQTP